MAGIQEAMLGSVIDSFYEAAAEPSLWGDVLKQVSFVLGAEGTELFPGPEARLSSSPSTLSLSMRPLQQGSAKGGLLITHAWREASPH